MGEVGEKHDKFFKVSISYDEFSKFAYLVINCCFLISGYFHYYD